MTKEEWQAIKNRDRSYDGKFYYSVRSSGTFCRPSCTARRPVPQNVIIYPTYEEALKAGLTPCFRCRPDQKSWGGVKENLAEAAVRYLEGHYKERFSLSELSEALFVNGSYLSRVFRQVTGETLLTCHNRIRCEHACELLTHGEHSIAFIGSEVGFVSASHFSRIFRSIYGQTPSEYRKAYYKYLDE